MEKKSNISIVISAIGSITILETIALLKGIDGTYLAMGLVLVAGLGGYYVKDLFKRINL